MSDQTSKTQRERVQSEFESLPLEDKFASLFKMEMAAMSEGINLLVKDPMKVVEKVGDAISDLGDKFHAEVVCKVGDRVNAKAKTATPPKPKAAKAKANGKKKQPKPPMG